MSFPSDDFAAVDIHDQVEMPVLASHNGRTVANVPAPDLVQSGCRKTSRRGHRTAWILWRQMKYAWLPLSAYFSFDHLCEEVHP